MFSLVHEISKGLWAADLIHGKSRPDGAGGRKMKFSSCSLYIDTSQRRLLLSPNYPAEAVRDTPYGSRSTNSARTRGNGSLKNTRLILRFSIHPKTTESNRMNRHKSRASNRWRGVRGLYSAAVDLEKLAAIYRGLAASQSSS
jgi:hypothetical protein